MQSDTRDKFPALTKIIEDRILVRTPGYFITDVSRSRQAARLREHLESLNRGAKFPLVLFFSVR